MSWQAYVDNLKQYPGVTHAAVAAHDGTIWAISEGFQVYFIICVLDTYWLYLDFICSNFILDLILNLFLLPISKWTVEILSQINSFIDK